ncbi:type II secretion system F family protein [Candidatus Margulisiibacteriota bacterium]
MPNFKYTAQTPEGKKTTGIIDASDASNAADLIKKYGFLPIKISEIKESFLNKKLYLFINLKRPKDILLFTRELATLLGAGLPILSSLDAILEQSEGKDLTGVIRNIKEAIAGGSRFSEALKKHPQYFSPVYINMIIAGEKGGLLVDMLSRLTSLIEYEESTRIRIKKAVRYPIMVVSALVIASSALVVFVFPQFMGIFKLFSGNLPLPTRALIIVNSILINYWYLLLAAAAGLFWGLKYYINTEKGHYHMDWLMISVPILGPLIRKLIISRFARVLALLHQSGLPIVEAVGIVLQTTNNIVYVKALEDVREKIRGGKGISGPLKESGLFPLTLVKMVSVGEKSGNLSDMLSKAADYFDEEVDLSLDNLSSLIEPVLIVILGVVVLFVALAVFLPMWNMISLIK